MGIAQPTMPSVFKQRNGITKKTFYKKRRELILEENSECSICGYNIKEVLELHHIVPVGEGGDLIAHDNIIVLCPNCHSVIHYLIKNWEKIWNDRFSESRATAYSRMPNRQIKIVAEAFGLEHRDIVFLIDYDNIYGSWELVEEDRQWKEEMKQRLEEE